MLNDPKQLEEAKAMLNDPEQMARAQEMMDDPEFRAMVMEAVSKVSSLPLHLHLHLPRAELVVEEATCSAHR